MKPIGIPGINGIPHDFCSAPGQAYLDAINAFGDATNPALFVDVAKWMTLWSRIILM